jgi:thioredoxin 1
VPLLVEGGVPEQGEQLMATIELTSDLFQETVTADGIVLVDFWAEWCGPCKSFGPVFEAASEKDPEITFAKIDTEAEQEIAGALQIRSIPTLMIFRDGIQIFSQPGALPGHALDELIGQVKALDMDEVRADIAKEASSSDAD